jgi:hypothetical protein
LTLSMIKNSEEPASFQEAVQGPEVQPRWVKRKSRGDRDDHHRMMHAGWSLTGLPETLIQVTQVSNPSTFLLAVWAWETVPSTRNMQIPESTVTLRYSGDTNHYHHKGQTIRKEVSHHVQCPLLHNMKLSEEKFAINRQEL